MKLHLTAIAALSLTSTLAQAGGIDRSGQDIGALFETGRYMELSFGQVSPSVSGKDVLGNTIGNVGNDYLQFGFAYKADLNDKLSYALILDTPYAADVVYPGNPVATMLGTTSANASSTALTGLLRYKLNDSFSVHGGLRIERATAQIALGGVGYGGLNGYGVSLNTNTALGYSIGAAFEKPEIALRVALTYNSGISHDFTATETLGAATLAVAQTTVKTPQSVNLDFQSGVAKDTLVFGQIRWVDWSKFQLSPTFFNGATGGGGLIGLEDTITYTLGVGRKFNDTWSGAISLNYETAGDPLVSPLAPTNGQLGVTLAGVYTKGNMKITAGINYTKLGDAQPETGGAARADFTDNSAVGIGFKIGFTF